MFSLNMRCQTRYEYREIGVNAMVIGLEYEELYAVRKFRKGAKPRRGNAPS
jgi:hypothetical protein